jgi:hypothetical protein
MGPHFRDKYRYHFKHHHIIGDSFMNNQGNLRSDRNKHVLDISRLHLEQYDTLEHFYIRFTQDSWVYSGFRQVSLVDHC